MCFYKFVYSLNISKKLVVDKHNLKLYLLNMKRTPGLFAICLLPMIFFACSRSEVVESLSEDELFSLNYGEFEEQLDLFSVNEIGQIQTGLVMKDGFFYIVNGESEKILELNSFGDMLSLYYNEDSNTKKLVEDKARNLPGIYNEISYPFSYPGLVAVDSHKCIYVACTIPRDRQETSEDKNILLSQTVLRIAKDGSAVDYIGQQGPGGTPFPFIKNIYTNEKDELIVVSVANSGMIVYWFADNGFLKYMIPISADSIPEIKVDGSENPFYANIENVIPAYDDKKLYCKIDYYSDFIDKETHVLSGINFEGSYLYPFDITTALFEEGISIPPYEQSVVVDYSRLTYEIPYDFLGVTKSGWKYFLIQNETGFDIQMLQSENQRILRRHFDVNHNNVLYYNISLSSEGIITALYAGENNARVVWYRTDKLISN